MRRVHAARRRLLKAAGASGLAALAPRALAAKETVNDVSQLNPVEVAGVRRPRSTEDIQAALHAWAGAVSIGGARFSQGGQIAERGSLHLDMRAINKVVSLDPARRTIRVQAGATWRDVQDAIDPHDLSVKIMQSFSNFSVGGALSVNCHGRYLGRGPVVNSVRSLSLVTADARVLELLNMLGKVDIGAVQYKGGGPALVAVLGSEVGITFQNSRARHRQVE